MNYTRKYVDFKAYRAAAVARKKESRKTASELKREEKEEVIHYIHYTERQRGTGTLFRRHIGPLSAMTVEHRVVLLMHTTTTVPDSIEVTEGQEDAEGAEGHLERPAHVRLPALWEDLPEGRLLRS